MFIHVSKLYQLLPTVVHAGVVLLTAVHVSELLCTCVSFFRMTDMYGSMELMDATGDAFWLVMRSRSSVIPGCGVLTT